MSYLLSKDNMSDSTPPLEKILEDRGTPTTSTNSSSNSNSGSPSRIVCSDNIIETMIEEGLPSRPVDITGLYRSRSQSPSSRSVTMDPSLLPSNRRRSSPMDLDEKLKMSAVSRLYDRNSKGYLDDTEKALRRMDSQNLGFLDNEKVYKIMHSLQEEQVKSAALIESWQKEHKKAMSLKRGVIYMSIFAFLLAISNIGTSFAAARLAKDVSASPTNDLVDKYTGVRLATTSKTVLVELEPIEIPVDPVSRRLHERFLQEATDLACGTQTTVDYTNTDWTTEGVANSIFCEAVGHISYNSAVKLYQQFCPSYPFLEGTTTPYGCNLNLNEVMVKCGTRMTRVLGGGHFPLGGVPGYESGGSWFVFPAATPAVPVADASSLYFDGLQLVDEPLPSFSLVANPPPQTCEEQLSFKLYCSPNNAAQGCMLIHLYWGNQRNCQGQVQMCQAATGTPLPVQRRVLRMGEEQQQS